MNIKPVLFKKYSYILYAQAKKIFVISKNYKIVNKTNIIFYF